VAALAAATDDAVFKLWEGLGYYSRCGNLLACARQVMDQHSGKFPRNYDQILQLKGVGPYTAAAISSFAWNLPHAVVDGNVIRVLARYFEIETPFDSTGGRKLFFGLANELIDQNQPAAWNQAIMDFGATVCTPANPGCLQCPLQQGCCAFKSDKVESLPVKTKKPAKKTRWLHYIIFRFEDKLLVRQRLSKDIWHLLYEFYLEEFYSVKEWEATAVETNSPGIKPRIKEIIHRDGVFKQQLTHQTVIAKFTEVKLLQKFEAPAGYQWLDNNAVRQLAFPRIINAWLAAENQAAVSLF
jgi:A/G-specific adenine glycosylase